jgi:hypothetical protein
MDWETVNRTRKSSSHYGTQPNLALPGTKTIEEKGKFAAEQVGRMSESRKSPDIHGSSLTIHSLCRGRPEYFVPCLRDQSTIMTPAGQEFGISSGKQTTQRADDIMTEQTGPCERPPRLKCLAGAAGFIESTRNLSECQPEKKGRHPRQPRHFSVNCCCRRTNRDVRVHHHLCPVSKAKPAQAFIGSGGRPAPNSSLFLKPGQ